MVIHGIQKLTLVDFPHFTSCILFSGGCNFRCPFCHNSSLVLAPSSQPVIEENEIFSFLKKRKKMLEGVVITGGEPTLNSDLIPFMEKIKDLGYKVKLDTNGYRPNVLQSAIEKHVVDYVAMDIKTSLDEYPLLTGIKDIDTDLIKESISILLKEEVDYEFRTTVVNELHNEKNFEKIGKIVEGAKSYYLQTFIDKGNTIEKGLTSPSLETLESYKEILNSYIENVSIRDR